MSNYNIYSSHSALFETNFIPGLHRTFDLLLLLIRKYFFISHNFYRHYFPLCPLINIHSSHSLTSSKGSASKMQQQYAHEDHGLPTPSEKNETPAYEL